jgi:hypothetical protein
VPRIKTDERGGSVERIDGAARAIVLRLTVLVVCNPICSPAPVVVPGDGEHVRQCLDRTCGVTVAFLSRKARMQVSVDRCAGLDVRRETVVTCVLVGTPGLRPSEEIHTRGAMTRDLGSLRD